MTEGTDKLPLTNLGEHFRRSFGEGESTSIDYVLKGTLIPRKRVSWNSEEGAKKSVVEKGRREGSFGKEGDNPATHLGGAF